jgi:hypothetical protein
MPTSSETWDVKIRSGKETSSMRSLFIFLIQRMLDRSRARLYNADWFVTQSTLWCKEDAMNDIKQIRLVASNFYNLQGLRAVPLGTCLLLVTMWANQLHGPAKDFLVPILSLAGSVIILSAVHRYYLHTFGRVQRTRESLRLEWLVSGAGGILALSAFWLDVSFELPVSLLGLVFAAGLLADYLRMTWLVKGQYLLYYPLGAILMAGLSILQLLGVSNWWLAIGLKNQLLGIVIAIAIFTMVAGVWGHIFLARTLPSRTGTDNDNSI